MDSKASLLQFGQRFSAHEHATCLKNNVGERTEISISSDISSIHSFSCVEHHKAYLAKKYTATCASMLVVLKMCMSGHW